MSAPTDDPCFFRHEHARLIAALSRRVGVQHLEAVEDAVQSALLSALERWRVAGAPEDPSAWLFRVAQNRLLGELRQRAGRRRILERASRAPTDPEPASDPPAAFADEVKDDLLRMLFVCCDEVVPEPSRLVLALRTLCGFSVREIALRLFASEANVYKRLARARTRLRETRPALLEPSPASMAPRLPSVHRVLYLLFTEGYLSSHAEQAIRRELCHEAIRLALLLAEHPVGQTPETRALVALMLLHAARISARQDGAGGLLLLEEQDRSRWDKAAIQAGLAWLARSAEGDAFTRYHAEAAIAAEHCLAPSYGATRWDRVAEGYAMLERVAPSPLVTLNRAVAVAEWRGPEAGLGLRAGLELPSWLEGSHLVVAVLADLHRRAGHAEQAARYRDRALASAPTPAVRALLHRRLDLGAAT
ncbi:MAG: RNA polymerase sigma factor [Sandaracinaceae bacterium]